ncbi:MAG TPA: hypothetical protein VHD85_12225 [Terracidiphilus sp.]|nr:hypothetical protein [Terracidiphilus sp.]
MSRSVRPRSSTQRIKKFGKFFTGYMGTASLVTAALPIPVAKLHLIPTYASQSKFLNTYASLICFLVFAFIFYIRHILARAMFHRTPEKVSARWWITVLPFLCICASIACVIGYHIQLDASLSLIAAHGVLAPTQTLLAQIDYREIPLAEQLTALYLGMFVFAESAFVLMAMREYLQEILGLEEQELIDETVQPTTEQHDSRSITPAKRLRRITPLRNR